MEDGSGSFVDKEKRSLGTGLNDSTGKFLLILNDSRVRSGPTREHYWKSWFRLLELKMRCVS